jgi:hypothetical protein
MFGSIPLAFGTPDGEENFNQATFRHSSSKIPWPEAWHNASLCLLKISFRKCDYKTVGLVSYSLSLPA